VVAQLAASQEGLGSMELISYYLMVYGLNTDSGLNS
jgi:hypothetical protein